MRIIYLCVCLLLAVSAWHLYNHIDYRKQQASTVHVSLQSHHTPPPSLEQNINTDYVEANPQLSVIVTYEETFPQMEFIISQLAPSINAAYPSTSTITANATRDTILQITPTDIPQLPALLKRTRHSAVWLKSEDRFVVSQDRIQIMLRALSAHNIGLIFNADHVTEEWMIMLSNASLPFVGQFIFIEKNTTERALQDDIYAIHTQISTLPTLVIAEPSPVLFRYLSHTLQGFEAVNIAILPISQFLEGNES